MNRTELVVVVGTVSTFTVVFGYLFGQKILITTPTPLEGGIIMGILIVSFMVVKRIWRKSK